MSRMQRKYFHIGYRIILLDRLGHDLDTTECQPDRHDESGLVDVCPVQSDHQDTSGRDEDRLTDARVDSGDIHITSIVDLFHKK